jgi:hypothetical protein
MLAWRSFSHVERDRDLSLRTVTAPATYASLQQKATYASSSKEHDLKLLLDLWTTVRDEGPPASPLTTLAVGTGLRQASVGRSALFVLMNNDPNGRALHVGGAPWSVHVTGPGKVVTSIVDHDDGTVTVRYTCSCSGLHRVYVRLHDDHLAGSPFDVQVAVGIPAPCVVKRAAASARTLRGLMTRWAALSRVRPVHEERARFASNTAALAEMRVVFELVKVGVQHLMAQRLARGLRAFCDVAARRRATLEAVRRAMRRLLGYQTRSGLRQWKREAERLREERAERATAARACTAAALRWLNGRGLRWGWQRWRAARAAVKVARSLESRTAHVARTHRQQRQRIKLHRRWLEWRDVHRYTTLQSELRAAADEAYTERVLGDAFEAWRAMQIHHAVVTQLLESAHQPWRRRHMHGAMEQWLTACSAADVQTQRMCTAVRIWQCHRLKRGLNTWVETLEERARVRQVLGVMIRQWLRHRLKRGLNTWLAARKERARVRQLLGVTIRQWLRHRLQRGLNTWLAARKERARVRQLLGGMIRQWQRRMAGLAWRSWRVHRAASDARWERAKASLLTWQRHRAGKAFRSWQAWLSDRTSAVRRIARCLRSWQLRRLGAGWRSWLGCWRRHRLMSVDQCVALWRLYKAGRSMRQWKYVTRFPAQAAIAGTITRWRSHRVGRALRQWAVVVRLHRVVERVLDHWRRRELYRVLATWASRFGGLIVSLMERTLAQWRQFQLVRGWRTWSTLRYDLAAVHQTLAHWRQYELARGMHTWAMTSWQMGMVCTVLAHWRRRLLSRGWHSWATTSWQMDMVCTVLAHWRRRLLSRGWRTWTATDGLLGVVERILLHWRQHEAARALNQWRLACDLTKGLLRILERGLFRLLHRERVRALERWRDRARYGMLSIWVACRFARYREARGFASWRAYVDERHVALRRLRRAAGHFSSNGVRAAFHTWTAVHEPMGVLPWVVFAMMHGRRLESAVGQWRAYAAEHAVARRQIEVAAMRWMGVTATSCRIPPAVLRRAAALGHAGDEYDAELSAIQWEIQHHGRALSGAHRRLWWGLRRWRHWADPHSIQRRLRQKHYSGDVVVHHRPSLLPPSPPPSSRPPPLPFGLASRLPDVRSGRAVAVPVPAPPTLREPPHAATTMPTHLDLRPLVVRVFQVATPRHAPAGATPGRRI